MDIKRPSPGGEWLAVIEARFWHQAVLLDWQGEKAPFIESGITLTPAERMPDSSHNMHVPQVQSLNRGVLKDLFVDQIIACRMPRPAVDPEHRYGADVGTMQAATAALVRRLDQIRR